MNNVEKMIIFYSLKREHAVFQVNRKLSNHFEYVSKGDIMICPSSDVLINIRNGINAGVPFSSLKYLGKILLIPSIRSEKLFSQLPENFKHIAISGGLEK